MSKQREALEKALLALEIAPLDHNSVKSSFFEKRHYAIIALREALAEPELMKQAGWTQTRKSLTDEEIDNLELPPNGCTMRELVRAVERAHGIGD